MSEYTRYLKCPEHGIFEASFKTCPQCFPDEDTGDEFEAMKAEIASLQEASAEKDAIIEAQSEELGKARGFIRDLADESMWNDDYGNWINKARELVAQWEAESESEVTE